MSPILLELIDALILEIVVNDLNALLDEKAARAGSQPCVIGRALADLPDPYKAALQTLINSRFSEGGYTDDQVAARMRSAGLRSSATSVRQHRRGFCSCP